MEREGGHVGSFFERREEGESILKFEPSQNSNTARSPTVPLKKCLQKNRFSPLQPDTSTFFSLETKLKCPTKDDFFLTRLSLFGHPLSVEEAEVVKAGGREKGWRRGGRGMGSSVRQVPKPPPPSSPLPPPPSKVEEGSRGGERWRWKEY